MQKSTRGFTLVELAIVIAVISILATITLVGYRAMQQRTIQTALQADLEQSKKKIDQELIANNGRLPSTLDEAGITSTAETLYTYYMNNSVTPGTYCLSVSRSALMYYVDNASRSEVTPGDCSQSDSSAVNSETTTLLASSENPPAESKDKLFDLNTNTKWLSFNPTGWIIFSTPTPRAVSTYTLISANDFPARTPSSWVLAGSFDRISWTTINTQSAQSFTTAFQSRTYTVTNPQYFMHYRFTISQNNGDPGAVQFSELRLYEAGSYISVIR